MYCWKLRIRQDLAAISELTRIDPKQICQKLFSAASRKSPPVMELETQTSLAANELAVIS